MEIAHRLPRVPVYRGRQEFVLTKAAGQRVLHIGCVDAGLLADRFASGVLLHQRLAAVAESLTGVDIDAAGIAFLRAHGFPDCIAADAERLDQVAALRTREFDVIVAAEVVEHLASPGAFLRSVAALMQPQRTRLLLSVPNAHNLTTLVHLWRGREVVHPDHNYWFSYVTVTGLLRRHGFVLDEVAAYSFHGIGRRLDAPAPRAGAPPARPPPPAPGLASRLARAPATLLARVLHAVTPAFVDGWLVVASRPPAGP